MYNPDNSLKTSIRIILLMFITVAMVVGFFATVKGLSLFAEREISNEIYHYEIDASSAYQVKLKENSFIEKDYLGEGETYIAQLVDDLILDFNYSYLGSEVAELTYDYEIYAIITIEYRPGDEENNRLWHKQYEILENSASANQKINIEKEIMVNYEKYNYQAKSFAENLQLPIDAKVDIFFEVNLRGQFQEKTIRETTQQKISVPLDLVAFNIQKDMPVSTNEPLVETIPKEVEVDYEFATLGGILMFSALFSFLVLFNKLFNIQTRSEYVIERDKILKSHGDIIVEIVTPIEKEGLSIIEVKNFNEMVDLEEELRIPIMFYEDPQRERGEFALMHRNLLYVYEI